MQEATDMDLLRDFAREDSEEAFATLVHRHVNLVYATALRKAGKAHSAEEITQAVFIILVRKASGLGPVTVLPAWLHQSTRLTTANFLRGEFRRVHREQELFRQAQEPEPAGHPLLYWLSLQCRTVAGNPRTKGREAVPDGNGDSTPAGGPHG